MKKLLKHFTLLKNKLFSEKIGIVSVIYFASDKHLELAVESHKTFKSNKYRILNYGIVNKWRDGDRRILREHYNYIIENDENCLAKAWNIGVKKALNDGCKYVLLPNLDLRLDEGCIDNLISFARNNPDAIIWSAYCTNGNMDYVTDGETSIKREAIKFDENGTCKIHYSKTLDSYTCFLIDKKLFNIIGEFDENIKPAYGEDNDMEYRIHLNNMKHLCTKAATFFHHGSMTIRAHDDPEWAKKNLSSSMAEKYLIEKWGGTRENMHYKTPFNK